MGFYAVNSSWAAPIILSTTDEKSLDFREKLVTSQQTIEDLKVDTNKLSTGVAEMKAHRAALLEYLRPLASLLSCMSQQIPKFPTLGGDTSLPESETVQIQLSLAGDLQAFSDLVRPYRPMFYKKALSIVRNESDADDVTQTALLKAFTKLSQFRLDSQFRTWATSIVINESLMCLRANRRAKEESLDRDERNEGSSPIDVADPRESQFHILQNKQLRAAILKAVSVLPLLLRTVFILRELRLRSIADTARMLGITETCVKTRLRRARLQLQQTLAHFRGAQQADKRDKSDCFTNSVPWSRSSQLASDNEMEAIH